MRANREEHGGLAGRRIVRKNYREETRGRSDKMGHFVGNRVIRHSLLQADLPVGYSRVTPPVTLHFEIC